MKWNNIKITIFKELRGIIRDKKSLQKILLMPLIVPAMLLLFGYLFDYMGNSKYVVGIKSKHMRIKKNLDSNLMLAKSLNIKIGYDKASQNVKYAVKEGLSLRDSAMKLGFLTSEEYDQIVQPKKMI